MDLVFTPSQIETWPIDRLRPYARNAKIHGIDQVARHHAWCVCQLIYYGNVIRASAD